MGATNKRLFGPAQLTAVTATKYTVPALTKTLIRHIHFFNADTSARTVTTGIGADAAGTRLLDGYSIPAKSPYDWFPFMIMDAAEILPAHADVTLQVNMTIFGTESVL